MSRTITPVADPHSVLEYLHDRQATMTSFLRSLVELESPSDVPESQQRVFVIVRDALEQVGFETFHLPGTLSGGQLYARPRSRAPGQPVQLLLGHSDTVWPIGTLEEMPVKIRDGRLFGPGSFDMKAGLTQMIFALRAMDALGLEPRVLPVVFINSDEEIGSPDSLRTLRRLARVAERTFVLEPALGPSGKLKTARKGVGRFTISITGKAAHAGLDPGGGASAIVELSHVIQSLHALNDPERGVSVNVGTIVGGERPNVVAAASRAVVDVRVRTMEDAREVESQIRALEAVTSGVELRIEGRIGRPPMERTPRNRVLWRLAQAAGKRLGLELEEGFAGGGSDGNEASLYSATLDGLGAVGDGAHADYEHVYLEKMPERAALLALLVMADPISGETTPASHAVSAEKK